MEERILSNVNSSFPIILKIIYDNEKSSTSLN